jgi:beta-phosphoglucomutase
MAWGELMTIEIRAFIFDMDGVITDTIEYHFLAWKRLAEEENIPFTREDNDQLLGMSRRESLNRLLKGRSIDEDLAQTWMRRKNDYFQEYLQCFTPANRLPGVTSFLDEARAAGLLLGIGSSSMNTRDVLRRLELHDFFDAVGDANSVTNTKPAPDVFLWVAGRLNVSPAQTVVFEDAAAGIEAALRGGFWTVGIGSANVSQAHVNIPDLMQTDVQQILRDIRAAPTRAPSAR